MRIKGKFILTFIVAALLFGEAAFAQVDSLQVDSLPPLTNEYLDTVKIVKTKDINDYTMIGVNYGVSLNSMLFNPTVTSQMLFNPVYCSVMFTKYEKMFGYLPYFGFQIGIAYGREGYKFKENEETGITHTIDGATQATFNVIEIPAMAQIHIDADFFKMMINIGMYGGYRTSITRVGPEVTDDLRYSFKATDRRWDYGLQGGLGFGLMFSPIEIHLGALLRYSWSSIYTPDSSPSKYAQYYYRYAYPFDIMITAGVHFQLTKRTGKTSGMLKKEARESVYNKKKDNED